MKRVRALAIPLSILCILSSRAEEQSKPASLDDLKKLDIICFVPSYLPKDFKLKSAQIITEENSVEGQATEKVATYAIEWSGPNGAAFSIESAWEGIGDRNIMETEDSEEAEFQSPLFGRVYIIYMPKGKGDAGVKKEILSNWVEDANMQMQPHDGRPITHAGLGRFHGFTGKKMTVAEFSKIVTSLHSVKGDAKATASAPPPLKLHPKIFNMIDCWTSDSQSPVVTEINLDAVETNGNQFAMDDVKPDGEWTRVSTKDDGGFMRYRVLGLKGNTYTVEYQENGGGSLSTDSKIEFVIDKRTIQRDGQPFTMRVLRVVSYESK